MKKRIVFGIFMLLAFIGIYTFPHWKSILPMDHEEILVMEHAKAKQEEAEQAAIAEAELSKQKAKETLIAGLDRTLLDFQFNGSALIVKDGEILLDKGYGYADFTQNIENHSHTKFWIGSITKMSIAVAILQLQEAGKLRIDDNINQYIPSFAASKNIQIRHLLTHTSGLPDKGAGRVHSSTPLSYVNWIAKQRLEAVPGASWKYSDYNYVVLAYIVETLSGESITQYVQKNIFEKAGLVESGFGSAYSQVDNQSKSYKRAEDKTIEFPAPNLPLLYGNGDIYSTTHDIYKLDRALLNGTLLSEESLQQMMTPGSDSMYGFGFYISPDGTRYNHGVIAGWDTYNTFHMEKGIYIILFSNIQGLHQSVNQRLMELLIADSSTKI